MKRLNLDYLESFAVVIDSGSFSAAAERLQLTQPAVSLQVRQLEKSLNATKVLLASQQFEPETLSVNTQPYLQILVSAWRLRTRHQVDLLLRKVQCMQQSGCMEKNLVYTPWLMYWI